MNFNVYTSLKETTSVSNKIVFDNSTSSSANYSRTENIEELNLKPNTTYTSKAKVTLEKVQDGGASAGSMVGCLILQTSSSWASDTKYYIVGEQNVLESNAGKTITVYSTFTTPSDLSGYKYLVTRLTGYSKITFENIILVEGSYNEETFPTVSVFSGPTTFNIYLDQPLRKVGDYADYIDFSTGKVVRQVSHSVLSSNLTWRSYSDNQEDVLGFYADDLPKSSYYKTKSISVSNRFKRTDTDIAPGAVFSVNYETFYMSEVLKISISKERILKEGTSDINTFKSWLDENEVYIEYLLEAPDDTETIELPELIAYEDYTNIEILTEVAPSKIEVTYDGYEF